MIPLLSQLVLGGPERVVIDSDPGYFNDDCQAAVMLLRSPEKAAVAGITVVSGNTWAPEGRKHMEQALKAIGRSDVPMFMGAQIPLTHTAGMAKEESRRWGPFAYMAAFEKPFPAGGEIGSRGGVDFLIETIERFPGEVVILAIGPMTNLAVAFRLRPDLETKIKQIVFMGGNVRVPGNATKHAEVNFWFDPEAAQVVMRSRVPRKIMFGLDICNRAVFTRKQFDEIVAAKTPATELFKDALGNGYPGFLKDAKTTGYIWDPLAAGYLIDSKIVTSQEPMYLDVDARFGEYYGAVTPLDRKLAPEATPVQVMLGLDYPRFFALFKSLLTRR